MDDYGRIVKAALALLMLGDAELSPGLASPGFRAANGRIISARLARKLANAALARKRGARFTLTAAGRRHALALQTRTAS
jgi:hypothetical protein